MPTIEVLTQAMNVAALFTTFEQRVAGAGAIASFLGSVRGENENSTVTALHLEHFPGLTEQSIATIDEAARARFGLIDTLIVHRVGVLSPGEPIVLVCAAAAHRRASFQAVDFMMDYLKTEALFWKKEIRLDGEAWIEPREEDYLDAKRWREVS